MILIRASVLVASSIAKLLCFLAMVADSRRNRLIYKSIRYGATSTPGNNPAKDLVSLPLNSRRRLPRDVIDNPRHPPQLIDDPVAHRTQELVRQMRPMRGHEVDRLHGP